MIKILHNSLKVTYSNTERKVAALLCGFAANEALELNRTRSSFIGLVGVSCHRIGRSLLPQDWSVLKDGRVTALTHVNQLEPVHFCKKYKSYSR